MAKAASLRKLKGASARTWSSTGMAPPACSSSDPDLLTNINPKFYVKKWQHNASNSTIRVLQFFSKGMSGLARGELLIWSQSTGEAARPGYTMSLLKHLSRSKPLPAWKSCNAGECPCCLFLQPSVVALDAGYQCDHSPWVVNHALNNYSLSGDQRATSFCNWAGNKPSTERSGILHGRS